MKSIESELLKKVLCNLNQSHLSSAAAILMTQAGCCPKKRERKAEQEVSKVSLHTCQKQKQKRTAAMHC